MALEKLTFYQGKTQGDGIRNNLRPIAAAAIGSMPAEFAIAVDIPEVMTAFCVVAIALAILWASDLFFKHSKEVLGDIWLVGHTLVKGLEKIDNWIHGLFHWLDDAAHIGIQDIAHGVHDVGNRIYDLFSVSDRGRISTLERTVSVQAQTISNLTDSLNSAVRTLNTSISDLDSRVNNRITDTAHSLQSNIDSANKRIDDLVIAEKNDVLTLAQKIVDEANTRSTNDNTLQGEINSLNYYIDETIKPTISSLQGETTTLTTAAAQAAAAIQSATGEIQTLQGTVTQEGETIKQEEAQIIAIPAPVTTVETIVKTATTFTAAQLVTLAELADNPCLCLEPVGGIDTILALVGALEIGIL